MGHSREPQKVWEQESSSKLRDERQLLLRTSYEAQKQGLLD